jgi:3-phosphoshikimate 1-carboxyvinyltransferase
MAETDEMSRFFYQGAIAASKSLMNRALILQSFFPDLKLKGQSMCDDVRMMKAAVKDLNRKDFECGDAGTVLRFLALRLSRESGRFALRGSERLFSRPQAELSLVLDQLGVTTILEKDRLVIDSRGWKNPGIVHVNRQKSSQFATALLLNSWKLPFDLKVALEPKGIEDSYWQMSIELAKQTGLEMIWQGSDFFTVPANQTCRIEELQIEPDLSSVFPLAACAALTGEIHIEGIGRQSLQPDFSFIEFLKRMRVPHHFEKNSLIVQQAEKILPIEADLNSTPDLFPVMGILCAFAEGTSSLSVPPRLIYKESDRLKKTIDLLRLINIETKLSDEKLVIFGRGQILKKQTQAFTFDPDQDHRMAMAAGLLRKLDWPVTILNSQVVEKSFPEFWRILEVNP